MGAKCSNISHYITAYLKTSLFFTPFICPKRCISNVQSRALLVQFIGEYYANNIQLSARLVQAKYQIFCQCTVGGGYYISHI